MLPPAAEAVKPTSSSSSSPAARPPVWLALDEVTDPQNLGAIIRCAYCLGASGVLAASKNCAPLTGTVSKASAGARGRWGGMFALSPSAPICLSN